MAWLLYYIAKEHVPKPQRDVSLKSGQVLNSEIDPITISDPIIISDNITSKKLSTAGERPH